MAKVKAFFIVFARVLFGILAFIAVCVAGIIVIAWAEKSIGPLANVLGFIVFIAGLIALASVLEGKKDDPLT